MYCEQAKSSANHTTSNKIGEVNETSSSSSSATSSDEERHPEAEAAAAKRRGPKPGTKRPKKVVKSVEFVGTDEDDAKMKKAAGAKRLQKENKTVVGTMSGTVVAKKAKLDNANVATKHSYPTSAPANASSSNLIANRIISLGAGFKIPKRPRFVWPFLLGHNLMSKTSYFCNILDLLKKKLKVSTFFRY